MTPFMYYAISVPTASQPVFFSPVRRTKLLVFNVSGKEW